MKELFHSICNELKRGKNVVLATIVACSGSTPRGRGARMAFGETGELWGTIGGGAVEFEAQKIARALLHEKGSIFHDFLLKPNPTEDLGMVCGGGNTVFFQFISHEDTDLLRFFEEAAEQWNGRSANWLVTAVGDGNHWNMYIADQENHDDLPSGLLQHEPVFLEESGTRYFAEPFAVPGFTYLFGGGHVSQELVPLLSHLGFRCVVFEDRPEFARRDLFPSAEQVILGNFGAVLDRIDITEYDDIVIMTRGHEFDYEVERQVLGRHVRYIGVMGSRTKIKHTSEKLIRDGFTADDLKKIHTPIGVDILSETPAEIAVSIAAEMIRVRAEASR